MSKSEVKKVPPDGGYGWVVTFAYAINNVVVLPLLNGIGLVFQEAFDDVELTATQGALIIILNYSIGMLLSFFGGPLLKRFGYRKVAVTGAIFVSSGIMLTASAKSFWYFILSYSLINSIGVAAVMAAFTLAINSFFKDKRGRAIGAGMSMTGLGTIYIPLLMDLLLSTYGWRGTLLLLGAICLHSIAAACLLRPVKWYLKDPPVIEELEPLNKDTNDELINGSLIASSPANGTLAVPKAALVENGSSPTKSISLKALTDAPNEDPRHAVSHPDLRNATLESTTIARYKWWESQEINLGSSINIFNETDINKSVKSLKEDISEKEPSKTITRKFIEFFDLTLLSDPIFVNILVGLSIASCVEINFSLLFPIILKDLMEFETSQIAKVMAVIGFSDTLFRVVSPFIGEWCHKPPRVMYMIASLMIIFTRTIMLFTSTFTGMLFVALAIGVTKGIRTVYLNIIIPSYVPIERLPFASGIQMLVNGFVIITIGSILGRIREASGSYVIPIMIMNLITLVTVIVWTSEFVYVKYKNKVQESNNA